MGGKQSLQYAVPVTNDNKEGESEIYRNPLAKDQLIYRPSETVDTMQKALQGSKMKYGDRKCLGTRDPSNGNTYQWKTYEECIQKGQDFASGLLNLNMVPEINEYKDITIRFLAIFAKNREEYLITDMASQLYGITTVPVYDTLGPDVIAFILGQTNLTSMCLTEPGVQVILKQNSPLGKLKNLISWDPVSEESKKLAEEKGFNLVNFEEVCENGKKTPQDLPQVKPETIYTFSYTSGTTGNPKGVMITHKSFLATINSLGHQGVDMNCNDVHLSYLPMAHVFERLCSIAMLFAGGQIGYYSGDVQKIKQDLGELKPTIFPSVPRLFNRFHDLIKGNLDKAQGVKKKIADRAVSAKAYYLENGCYYTHKIYDALVFGKVKNVFGGRVKFMLTGSAPIAGNVIDFLKIAACCPIVEGYGQTESCGASFATRLDDPKSGHVGGPVVAIEFKVVDVAEMGYTSKDKNEQGELTPRGEICVRGPPVFLGYYKDEAKTKEAIDEDGWLHTGDIGVILPNGALKIVDRKKNIFKLAHGEYVASEKIEIVYCRSNSVEECFIYGDSLQAFLVAAVLPKQAFVKKVAEEKKIEGSFQELVEHPEINKAILADMTAHGKSEKLLGFEQAKKIKLVSTGFADLGLHTTTFKLKRHEAKLHFQADIDRMYAEGN